jgi:hypothetical protein
MMNMADPQDQPQTPLSSEEGWPELEEQDLRGVIGGGVGNLLKPLLKPFQKEAAKAADEAAPHPNNGTYRAPGWLQSTATGKIHVFPPDQIDRSHKH